MIMWENTQFYHRGFSLLDAIFTLVIIAVITLASVTYFRQAEHQVQTTALLSEIKAVIQAAEEYNNENGNFAGIDATAIAKKHYVVPRYNVILPLNGVNYLVDPWTGLDPSGVDIAGITVAQVRNDPSHMQMTIVHLPSFACGQVLVQLNQYMDIQYQGGFTDGQIQQYCIWQNTRDKFTTLGEPFTFTYPKRNQ